MTKEQFIENIAKYVQKYAPKYGIKVCSPIIAQACLESAYGTSELADIANNFFGLKYRSGRCPSADDYYIKVGSEQNANGSYTSSVMKWFNFPDMESGVIGYFDFINIPNYSNLKGVTDPKEYLENIKKDGYATSLKYVDNLMNVIKAWNLTQYDYVKPAKKYYRVQLGAYTVRTNAEKMVKSLKADGYSAIIKDDGKLLKVQLGAFSNKSNAESYSQQLKSKGYKTYIIYD